MDNEQTTQNEVVKRKKPKPRPLKERVKGLKINMPITQQQEEFLKHILGGATQAEAYRLAYRAKSDVTSKCVAQCASSIMRNPKMKARLAEMRQPAVERKLITLEQHLKDLQMLRDKAAASEKWGPAISAEIARGKAGGLHVDKIEHTGGLVVQQLVAGADDLITQIRGMHEGKNGNG